MTLKLAAGVMAVSATAFLVLLGGLHGPSMQQSVAEAVLMIPSALCAAQRCSGATEFP
ncbi:MAG: hypothetical protein ACOVKO_00705 [Elstera sp.]